MAEVEVWIPWAPGEGREEAFEFVRRRYAERYPQYPVRLAEPKPFSKARAANLAAREAEAEIVVLADADVWCDELEAAVSAVRDGASWAVPHRHVHRLTEEASQQVYSGASPEGLPLERRPYVGVKGGGLCVVRRDVLRYCPWDERYTAWGRADRSWRAAMTTFYGDPWRADVPLWHFWHPPQPRVGVKSIDPDAERLYERYTEARFDPVAIWRLVTEDGVREPWHVEEPHRTLICAAGTQRRWEASGGEGRKQLVELAGEPIIHRAQRLAQLWCPDVVVTVQDPKDPAWKGLNTRKVTPQPEKLGDMGKFLDAKRHWLKRGRTTILYGDVFYSEATMQLIYTYPLQGPTIFGRAQGKHWETHAFAFREEDREEVERVARSWIANGEQTPDTEGAAGPWKWFLHRITGATEYSLAAVQEIATEENGWVELDHDDPTDDFDERKHVERWLARFGDRVDTELARAA